MTDFRALCAELVEAWDTTSDFDYNDFGNLAKPLVARARAALAEPVDAPATVAERPSDDELGLIYHDCCRGCEFMDQVGFEDAARAVLARWGHPPAERHAAPVPVPVSDRPWERKGWCDEQGRCWFGREESDYWSANWTLGTPKEVEESCTYAPRTVCLPANALPLPAPQGEEVEQ